MLVPLFGSDGRHVSTANHLEPRAVPAIDAEPGFRSVNAQRRVSLY
jgi:hypothetical protein